MIKLASGEFVSNTVNTHTDLNLLTNIYLDELYYALLYNDDDRNKK